MLGDGVFPAVARRGGVDMGTQRRPGDRADSIHRLLDLRTSPTTERIPFTTSE